ncbi:zinc ribbon domain-containing protein [Sporofaciens musculi]|uniref:zinc ribbon domain-containing protein n=1 Tax=Sporofaciens musculi TaxID=2681861 RepID=UPI00216DF702|nr:zinc ribbon domain-containing protein [Sporofaciens musculi]MCI8885886.1 zinc ribbon domain-containing protein [Dorea sp.]
MNKNLGKLLGYIGIPVLLSAIVFRFVLFYFRSDGFSGMSMIFPLLAIGILIFALITSVFFAAWVYQDCKKRNDDGILWAVIIFITTPLIGLLIYFLRRCEMKQSCDACGHLVSLRAKFCEECGSKIERREEMKDMEMKRTHHINYIVIGAVSMILMLACLTGFIVSAVYGKGINSDINSNDRVWNMGAISMNYQSMKDGVWTLDFKSASDGFIAQEDMIIEDVETDSLYADISCNTVPDDSSITLYLVQGGIVRSFDVTSLSEPLEYPLNEFENGEIHVRLLIEGVEDTISKIHIK